MSKSIEKNVNELAMLLVMVDASDKTGIEALGDFIKKIKKEASKKKAHPRLADACSHALEQLKNLKSEEFLEFLNSFVSHLQSYLQDPERTVFANEKPEDEQPQQDSDLGEYFDPEFLVDFIEKHNMMLDDLEGRIVDFRFTEDKTSQIVSEFNSFVKGYLHNIKGDAGSIGLVGIEHATHEFEDILLKTPASELLDQLILYKEWVQSCIASYAKGASLQESSSSFIPRLVEECTAAVGEKKPQVTPEDELKQMLLMQIEEEFGPDESKKENEEEERKAALLAQIENDFGPDSVKEESPGELESYTIAADPELIAEFVAEAEDHLSNVESILLESTGEFSTDDIGTIFRGVHSLKGASSYFNLIEINETSHILENLLDEVRDGKRVLDQELVSLVFTYIDLQKKLLAQTTQAMQGDGTLVRSQEVYDYLASLEAYSKGESVSAKKVEKSAPDPVVEKDQPAAPAPAAAPAGDSSPAKAESKLNVKTFIKVDTTRLDSLVDTIGEMVIYSSMLIRNCRELLSDNEQILKTTSQVEKFSRDLQEIGMSMRLDPIKGLFQKMSRLVWDVSKKLGKEVSFSMSGEDTELDRTVIEKLADPLMHMVRNSIDHGIEMPDEREAAGKPRCGTVELSASHVGGNILIQIKDSGRGLDPQKIFKKAVEKGIVSENEKLSDSEIFNLVLAPGFSTAEKVTDISGRGVGMDVARNNIESMRGRIRIESQVGQGTTFSIELPLTLAIVDGIEVNVGRERFIIPTLSVIELINPTPDMLHTTVGKGETFTFRESFLPLYRLSVIYDIEPKYTDPEEAVVIVVENSGEKFALMVDDIIGSCQTVIKNLGEMFEENKGLAGCSIMPDGEIGLILDVRSLAQLARQEYAWGAIRPLEQNFFPLDDNELLGAEQPEEELRTTGELENEFPLDAEVQEQ